MVRPLQEPGAQVQGTGREGEARLRVCVACGYWVNADIGISNQKSRKVCDIQCIHLVTLEYQLRAMALERIGIKLNMVCMPCKRKGNDCTAQALFKRR